MKTIFALVLAFTITAVFCPLSTADDSLASQTGSEKMLDILGKLEALTQRPLPPFDTTSVFKVRNADDELFSKYGRAGRFHGTELEEQFPNIMPDLDAALVLLNEIDTQNPSNLPSIDATMNAIYKIAEDLKRPLKF